MVDMLSCTVLLAHQMAVPASAVDAIKKFRLFTLSILSVAAPENVDNLGDLLALILLIAAINGVFDAIPYVIPKDFFFSAPQCSPHCRNLCDNIYAIAPFLDHARQATHLTFDAVKAFLDGGFGLVLHN
jgi:hypothetical protein